MADVLVRSIRRPRPRRWSAGAFAVLARERWPAGRIVAAGVALVSFSVTYFAYRNIKSVVPLLRPDELYDRELLDTDRFLFGGADPGALLQSALGTGAAAEVLATVYMLFFVFIPVALAAALVLLDLRRAAFVVTALAAAWLLGALSYLVLPAIGPFHVDAATYADLPRTSVTDMQERLMGDRAAFLAAPGAPGAAQSIGAFASLHTAFCGTAALAAHLVGAPRVLRAGIWLFTGLTVMATVYFGWHYLLDDVAGLVIAVLALGVARGLTGVSPRRVERSDPLVSALPEPARAT
jgi:hypothetical protein